MPNLGAGEWLIILLVIVILFGSAKLPNLARSLGKSMRILKAETKGLHDDDEPQQAQAQQPAQQPQQPQQGQQAQQGQQGQQGQQNYQAPPQRELPVGSDEAISGVPVTDAERRRNS
jgi:sec-independent protein translocase protein TatA